VTGGQGVNEIIRARPTVYKGIRMRSRLEADFAADLDRRDKEWKYERECFASPDGQWLPDFRVKTKPGKPDELVELKPAGLLYKQWASGETDKILARMTIAWASEPDVCLTLLYWNRGGPAAMVISSYGSGTPWMAGNTSMPLLWPGMGQLNAVCSAGADDGMRRALIELSAAARKG